MGTVISGMNSINVRQLDNVHTKREVEQLAVEVILPLLNGELFSHLVVATSCPDSIAPSLGQCIIERLHSYLGEVCCIDLVQGCAGGVNALILGSQLADINHSSVMVVTADAAQKATSADSSLHSIFSNGASACILKYTVKPKGLLKYRSRQYLNLSQVVTIKLGHDADDVIRSNLEDMARDPRKHLGLSMNNGLAIQLMKQAEKFYLDFIGESLQPDILLLHQVNPEILNHLQKVFSPYPVEFINLAGKVGNCGASTTGVVLHKIYEKIENKKVMICSFGTGGVITAGLWQF
jgi:3-oxoacyl-[acyl-carrier-protein] synthase III